MTWDELKEWQNKKNRIVQKRVYNQAGLDSKSIPDDCTCITKKESVVHSRQF